jgi:hypothetical protein
MNMEPTIFNLLIIKNVLNGQNQYIQCQVRRLGGGVYVVQASWSMEDHGSVEELA